MITFTTIRRIIGWIVVIIGLWFLTPPGFPPDDIINIFFGDLISRWFNISLVAGIASTYIIVAPILIYLGCVILPGDTHKIFNGIMIKARDMLLRIFKDPRKVLIAIIISVILYIGYVVYISQAITDIIESML